MEDGKHCLFIDFEFTMPEKNERYRGFSPEIIEAGAVFVRNGVIKEQFSSFVVPIRFPVLSERCKSFLHISQEQVDNGITFADLIHRLEQMGGKDAEEIVTWGNMDMKVLRQSCSHAGTAFPFKGKEVDLSMEYKRFFGDRNQTGLWKAVKEYGKEGTGRHHRALDDALTTHKIYQLVEKDKKYLQNPEPTTIGDRVDLSKLLNRFA